MVYSVLCDLEMCYGGQVANENGLADFKLGSWQLVQMTSTGSRGEVDGFELVKLNCG